MLYLGLRHFTYAGQRIEPGRVFQKLAVRNNHFLESREYVEEWRGREENLVSCSKCPAKFSDHDSMARHVENNVHKNGKIIHAEKGSRTKEEEDEIEQAQQEALINDPPKPGYVEANPAGDIVKEGKTRKAKSRR